MHLLLSLECAAKTSEVPASPIALSASGDLQAADLGLLYPRENEQL